MRSVTFADDKVIDLLNEKFVLCWNNHNPRERSGGEGIEQPKYTKEELDAYPEGGGGGNVRSYVCLPDGRITHYIEGWFKPERMLEELTFAATLDEKNAAARHDDHARAHREAQSKVSVPANLPEPGRNPEFRRHSMLGLQAGVHEAAKGLLLQSITKVLEDVKEQSQSRVIS